jgi:hypothetical protein
MVTSSFQAERVPAAPLPRWWRWAWAAAAYDLTGPMAVQAELRSRLRPARERDAGS